MLYRPTFMDSVLSMSVSSFQLPASSSSFQRPASTRMANRELRTANCEPRTADPGSRIPDPGSRIPDPAFSFGRLPHSHGMVKRDGLVGIAALLAVLTAPVSPGLASYRPASGQAQEFLRTAGT